MAGRGFEEYLSLYILRDPYANNDVLETGSSGKFEGVGRIDFEGEEGSAVGLFMLLLLLLLQNIPGKVLHRTWSFYYIIMCSFSIQKNKL